MANRICSWNDCTSPVMARGLCSLHYCRQKSGYPMDAPRFEADWALRFDQYVDRTDGCWWWTGNRLTTPGSEYGAMSVEGKSWRAHRLSYLLHYGDLPAGALICHHCDNPPCVNPAHLYAGDYPSNAADRERRKRRKIPRGEASATSKLTNEQVYEIRRLCATRELTQKQVAKQFDISVQMVACIHNRRNWTHI